MTNDGEGAPFDNGCGAQAKGILITNYKLLITNDGEGALFDNGCGAQAKDSHSQLQTERILFTISPLHYFTISPLHHFTISPLHHFTISLFHHFTN
jgi:hypothetical protein